MAGAGDSSESILGQVVDSRSESGFRIDDPYDGEPVIWIRSTSAGSTAATESYYTIDPVTDRRDRLKRRIAPDGSMVSYPDENTVVHGHVDSPDGIPNRSIKTVALANDAGRETWVATGGGAYQLISTTTSDTIDVGGIDVDRVLEDGVVISESWEDANGDRVRVDRYGGKTQTSADGNTTIQFGVAAGAGWDAQPDITTTQTELANGSYQSQVAAAGLTITTTSSENSYTNQAGSTTTTTESADGRTVTEVGPGGVTVVTQYHLDGQVKSVVGASIVDRYHTYSVAGGAITETVHFGSATSLRWRKTKRSAGRVVEVREPGPNGNDFVMTYSYDAKAGRTVVARTGLASQITERSGSISRSGLDMNGDGKLTRASSDRITETETYYENDGNGWRQVSVQRSYQTEGDWTATELQRVSRAVGAGGDVEVVKADGETLTITEAIDRPNKVVTRTTNSNRSNIPAVEIIVNGLLVSRSTTTVATPETYTYDGLRRATGFTDPRGKTTTHAYNTIGQLESATDAENNVTKFGYYPFDHANAGQLHWEGERTEQACLLRLQRRRSGHSPMGSRRLPTAV